MFDLSLTAAGTLVAHLVPDNIVINTTVTGEEYIAFQNQPVVWLTDYLVSLTLAKLAARGQ